MPVTEVRDLNSRQIEAALILWFGGDGAWVQGANEVNRHLSENKTE